MFIWPYDLMGILRVLIRSRLNIITKPPNIIKVTDDSFFRVTLQQLREQVYHIELLNILNFIHLCLVIFFLINKEVIYLDLRLVAFVNNTYTLLLLPLFTVMIILCFFFKHWLSRLIFLFVTVEKTCLSLQWTLLPSKNLFLTTSSELLIL